MQEGLAGCKLKKPAYEEQKKLGLVVAGVDVGSLYTKVVLLNCSYEQQNGISLLGYVMDKSGGHYKQAAEKAMQKVVPLAGLQMQDLNYVVSTGYGRYQVAYGDRQVTEISCHAYGAKFLFPNVHTVIDIGGQDSKVISVDDKGGVYDFATNDKCAAGAGRFLEVMARSLGFGLKKMGEASLLSKQKINMSSTCTVFAETEVISLLSEGYDRKDIAAAILAAIANRMMGLARLVGVREDVVMSGGVAKNVGMVKALQKKLGTTIHVPSEPQIVGALGAALLALKTVRGN